MASTFSSSFLSPWNDPCFAGWHLRSIEAAASASQVWLVVVLGGEMHTLTHTPWLAFFMALSLWFHLMGKKEAAFHSLMKRENVFLFHCRKCCCCCLRNIKRTDGSRHFLQCLYFNGRPSSSNVFPSIYGAFFAWVCIAFHGGKHSCFSCIFFTN